MEVCRATKDSRVNVSLPGNSEDLAKAGEFNPYQLSFAQLCTEVQAAPLKAVQVPFTSIYVVCPVYITYDALVSKRQDI